MGMIHPFIRKLASVAELPEEDLRLLEKVTEDVRDIAPRRDIIREGEKPDHVHLMLAGWACRYHILPNGKRQISAFMLPGDLCDAHVTILEQMDHSIGALTAAKVAFISKALMRELTDRPTIARALWWATLVDEAVLRAWIVNLGKRDAYDRIAHIVCETYARLQNVGLADGGGFEMPVAQEELGDALGLTSVHINRSLKRLREDGVMTFRRGHIQIHDVTRLSKAAGFDPAYLHLTRSTRAPVGVGGGR